MEEMNSFNAESVNLLLDTAKSEYENEHNRTSIIDSKTNIALPIISAYFFTVAQLNDYKSILNIKTESFSDFIIPAFLFCLYTFSLILVLISVIQMIIVIATRRYYTVKPSDLYTEDFLKNKELFLAVQLIRLYIEATKKNKETNNKRIPLYKSSWICVIISIIMYVFYIMIKNNI